MLVSRVSTAGRLVLFFELRVGPRARQADVAAGDARLVFRVQVEVDPSCVYLESTRDAWAGAWS